MANQATVGPQRVVFNTPAGDVVFAFYPEVAPRSVRQFLTLVANGVYDGTHFCRLERGFVLQLTDSHDRLTPLTSKQLQLIHPLKAEFSSLRHVRGVLSLAHMDNQPDSGETSFSILLGDAPHLDGKYTIFGFVEQGMDVVEELCKVPVADGNRPQVCLDVRRAILLDKAEQLALVPLVKAHPVDLSKAVIPPAKNSVSGTIPLEVGWGLMLMLALGVGCYFLWSKLPARVQVSLLLINVLIGSFLLLMIFLPVGQRHSLVAVAVFLGILGLLRLMSRFESPAT
jgi:cyclophilin family peptidyl-prolyl cis-trans isomerase